jgi:aspartyl-tRNA(Asn)/glutamyl-tRNA(Gln) amidotransferase subunit A
MDGVVPLAPGLDHLGPISATVAEAALTFDAMADPTGRRASASLDRGVGGLRIAYARDWFAGDPSLDPAVLRAADAAAERLAGLGADVAEAQMPDYTLMHAAGAVLLQAEALALHRADLAARGADYGRAAFRALVSGAALTAADLAAARRAAILLRAEIDVTVLADHDLILTATTLTPAPPLAPFRDGRPVWTPMRTLPFNLTGHPALSLPAGLSGGLPLGVQIIGRAGDEAAVCRTGHALESAILQGRSDLYFKSDT